eukprot:4958587-Alexandrium_andersonii.AAC.1
MRDCPPDMTEAQIKKLHPLLNQAVRMLWHELTKDGCVLQSPDLSLNDFQEAPLFARTLCAC